MGGKKKKGKGKKKKAAPPEPSPFENMDTPTLKEAIAAAKVKLDKVQLDRNYVQLERDMIANFFDITKREVRDLDLKTDSKDRRMEEMERNHRVEVRVYIQKVKHLEYEHKNNTRKVETRGESQLHGEREGHNDREMGMKRTKVDLKLSLKEMELNNELDVKREQEAHQKQLAKLRDTFQKKLDELRDRLDAKVEKLHTDMELRRKVEVHEIEERKNLHIADLMAKHERAFGEIKKYYNVITRENLDLIRDLKAQLKGMSAKQEKNKRLMFDISKENKDLKLPLREAQEEVSALREKLKDYQKDQLALQNARARLYRVHDEIRSLQASYKEERRAFEEAEAARDKMYDGFEGTVKEVQKRSGVRNLVLEKKLAGLQDEFEKRQAQFEEVLGAANLDPALFTTVSRKLDEVLEQRNSMIRDLKYKTMRVAKAHNDTLRALRAKLDRLGIPTDDIQADFTKAPVTTAPAGLVTRPMRVR